MQTVTWNIQVPDLNPLSAVKRVEGQIKKMTNISEDIGKQLNEVTGFVRGLNGVMEKGEALHTHYQTILDFCVAYRSADTKAEKARQAHGLIEYLANDLLGEEGNVIDIEAAEA